MARRTLRLISIVGFSVYLASVVACSKSAAPPLGGTRIASISEIEAQLQHQIAEPSAANATSIIKSGYETKQTSSISLFAGKTAVISYNWHGSVVLIRQGKPKDVSSLRATIQSLGAVTSTGSDGSEISVVAAAGKTPPLAFRLIGDWLINVNVSVAPSGQATTEEVRAFAASMTFRP